MEQWVKRVAFVASLIVVFVFFNSKINEKIDQKINNPDFIRKVANEIRLPFVIFDNNESIIADTGAMKYIEKIKIIRIDSFPSISEIVVTPKGFLAVPPILENIGDTEIGFGEPKRGKKFDLIYTSIVTASVIEVRDDSNERRRFRLQLVVLPDR